MCSCLCGVGLCKQLDWSSTSPGWTDEVAFSPNFTHNRFNPCLLSDKYFKSLAGVLVSNPAVGGWEAGLHPGEVTSPSQDTCYSLTSKGLFKLFNQTNVNVFGLWQKTGKASARKKTSLLNRNSAKTTIVFNNFENFFSLTSVNRWNTWLIH